jgi:DNA-binding transcriptional MerR regulator
VAEYRIDDLARAAGMTVRNVRVYQDRGLLPPPERRGRVGWYSDAHLARLRLISSLLERGYTFATIAELLEAWAQGRDLTDLLGLEDALTRPWSEEAAERISMRELVDLLGSEVTPGVIKRALNLGLIAREGTHFVVRSPQLLETARVLLGAGISLPLVLDLAELLVQDMRRVAHNFVTLISQELFGDSPDGLPAPSELQRSAELVEKLRPRAQRAILAVFALEMEHEVAAMLGETTRRAGRLQGRHWAPEAPSPDAGR